MKARIFFCCLLSLLLLVISCGKKSDPQPQDQKNLFTWASEEARLAHNGCLLIVAKMCGAVANVDGISLEIQPLNQSINQSTDSNSTDLPTELSTLPDSCEGCPFIPRETTEIAPQTKTIEDDCVDYAMTYCPSISAEAYRWRLVARNVFRAFPFVLTQVHIARKVPPEKK